MPLRELDSPSGDEDRATRRARRGRLDSVSWRLAGVSVEGAENTRYPSEGSRRSDAGERRLSQILNRKCITSKSFTTYSLPSNRSIPVAGLTPENGPTWFDRRTHRAGMVPRGLIVEPTGQVLSAGLFAVKPAGLQTREAKEAHTGKDCREATTGGHSSRAAGISRGGRDDARSQRADLRPRAS
jgi:hypothetical protein